MLGEKFTLDIRPTFVDELDRAAAYGRGFYTTADKELGKEWAVGQQADRDGWLHVYEADLGALKVFDFADVGVFSDIMKEGVT